MREVAVRHRQSLMLMLLLLVLHRSHYVCHLILIANCLALFLFQLTVIKATVPQAFGRRW